MWTLLGIWFDFDIKNDFLCLFLEWCVMLLVFYVARNFVVFFRNNTTFQCVTILNEIPPSLLAGCKILNIHTLAMFACTVAPEDTVRYNIVSNHWIYSLSRIFTICLCFDFVTCLSQKYSKIIVGFSSIFFLSIFHNISEALLIFPLEMFHFMNY